MKKLIVIAAIAISASLEMYIHAQKKMEAETALKASDAYIRNAVVQLIGPDGGGCTGVQIISPESGKRLILSAAHCMGLVDEKGLVVVQVQSGRKMKLAVLREDSRSDLMAIAGTKHAGAIEVAETVKMHDRVHAITKGAMAPAYRTDGWILEETPGGFVAFPIVDEQDVARCESMPKYKIMADVFSMLCVLDVWTTQTTAQIIPGSSGGPLLNEAGQLVGIASYTRRDVDTFGWFVRLRDVKAFLRKF